MRYFRASLVAGLLGLFASSATAATLAIGDPAPPLAVGQWIKGEKIEKFEPGKVYVVEFWATWSGPCQEMVPRLMDLQKSYKDKGVKFLAVSVFEEKPEAVAPFVKEMGAKMDYPVAVDDVPKGSKADQGKMALTWMQAAQEAGIPTVFVVKNGKIQWIGHPLELETPLEQIVAGKYDLAAATIERKQAKAAQAKFDVVQQQMEKQLAAKDFKGALKSLDLFLGEFPVLKDQMATTRLTLLMQAGDQGVVPFAQSLVDGPFKDVPEGLNALAWTIVDPDAPVKPSKALLKVALAAATRANVLTKGANSAILDTYAKALFDNGDPAQAAATQEKALKLAGDDEEPGMKTRLEEYRKAAQSTGKRAAN